MAGLDDDLRPALIEATARHAGSPEVTFDAYRTARYEDLRKFVSARLAVYLDMNFWISLRNSTEAEKPDKFTSLLAVLRNGVTTGQLFCPVSYAVFVELMKQKQVNGGRLSVAKLMDELSLCIGLRNPFDIAQNEYLTYFAARLPRLSRYIDHEWAPIGHLIHEVYPYQDELPHELMEQGRKVMCDVSWATKMAHMAKVQPPEYRRTAAERINAARQFHPRGSKTFSQLFASELDGALEEVPTHVDAILNQMRQSGFSPVEIKTMENWRYSAAVELRSAVLESGSSAIPLQRVCASLHAAMRLDDTRSYKPNDLHDFQHASVAVAYCDLFLTDGPLARLLTSPKVKSVIPDRCRVFGFGDFQAAIAHIGDMTR